MAITRIRRPIIQNRKMAGTVTHMLVNDLMRDYEIFMENRLDAAEYKAREKTLFFADVYDMLTLLNGIVMDGYFPTTIKKFNKERNT